jgi:hypothetical protein
MIVDGDDRPLVLLVVAVVSSPLQPLLASVVAAGSRK